jgi:hypothetical protein
MILSAYEAASPIASRAAARGARLPPLLLAGLLAACAGTPPPPTATTPAPQAAPRGTPRPAAPSAPPAITNAEGLRAAYGEPDFVRKEAGSELWRYDGANCALFAFLYRDGDDLKLRRLDSLPAPAGGGADPACVASVRARGAPVS